LTMRGLFRFACVAAAFGQPSQVEDLLTRQAQLEEQIAALQQAVTVLTARKLSDVSDFASIKEDITSLQAKDMGFVTALDGMWLLLCGALVVFMQAGFAILESGACRQKNHTMVLMKNVLDVCFSGIVWYLLGYGLAYGNPGEDANVFIGVQNFAGTGLAPPHHRDWFFQWAFCATAATIVSGAVAERIHFVGYVVYSIIMTGLIYPVIVWWTWSGSGWLTEMGYSDFAGSGIVHLTGGIGALVGAAIIKPRAGRWEALAKGTSEFDPHDMGMVTLGTFILWFGWYGFNCGSTLAFSGADNAHQAALVAMNTTISACLGGLTVFVVRLIRFKIGKAKKPFDLGGVCNGILVGLVSVCAGVATMEPHGALLIGIVAGLAEELGSSFVKRIGVDDPLDAFAVHGCGGMTGLLMAPLLDSRGVQSEMFAAHIVGMFAIICWSGGLSAATFGVLRVAGQLRVSAEEELEGCDEELAQHEAPHHECCKAQHEDHHEGNAI